MGAVRGSWPRGKEGKEWIQTMSFIGEWESKVMGRGASSVQRKRDGSSGGEGRRRQGSRGLV